MNYGLDKGTIEGYTGHATNQFVRPFEFNPYNNQPINSSPTLLTEYSQQNPNFSMVRLNPHSSGHSSNAKINTTQHLILYRNQAFQLSQLQSPTGEYSNAVPFKSTQHSSNSSFPYGYQKMLNGNCYTEGLMYKLIAVNLNYLN